jgi:hypothetical protein
MVGTVHDFLGGDEGEVRVRSDQAAQRAEDQGGMVVKDVSVCHAVVVVAMMRMKRGCRQALDMYETF